MDDLFVLKYSGFGADMYGLALVTTKKFADENPETVRGVVKALNQGTKETIASPGKALELLKARDPMMKLDIEIAKPRVPKLALGGLPINPTFGGGCRIGSAPRQSIP
jgi:ABC-type nitrate/sulfonate/bicarbonate transport system substrate-binding protein